MRCETSGECRRSGDCPHGYKPWVSRWRCDLSQSKSGGVEQVIDEAGAGGIGVSFEPVCEALPALIAEDVWSDRG